MKVYVLVFEKHDDGDRHLFIELFKTKAGARQAMRFYKQAYKLFWKDLDTKDQTPNSFFAYNEGWCNNVSFSLEIKEEVVR